MSINKENVKDIKLIDKIVDGTQEITYDNTTSGLTSTTIKSAIDELATNPATVDTFTFDTNYVQTGTEAQGTLFWDADNETVAMVENGSVLQIGQEIHYHVTKHPDADDIINGYPVVAVGTTGGSGKILVCHATVAQFNLCTGMSVTEIPAQYVIGLATEDIINNGSVTSFGKVNDVPGANYTQGVVYYVDDINGGLTTVSPNGLKMPIAFAINSDTLMVRTTPINERFIDEGVQAYNWGDHTQPIADAKQEAIDEAVALAIALG